MRLLVGRLLSCATTRSLLSRQQIDERLGVNVDYFDRLFPDTDAVLNQEGYALVPVDQRNWRDAGLHGSRVHSRCKARRRDSGSADGV